MQSVTLVGGGVRGYQYTGYLVFAFVGAPLCRHVDILLRKGMAYVTSAKVSQHHIHNHLPLLKYKHGYFIHV